MNSVNHVLKIDDISFQKKWEFDFLIDRKSVGDSVTITWNGDRVERAISAALIKRYGNEDKYLIYFLLLLGMTFWVIGVYVYRSKPNDWAARVFYSTSMAAVITIMIIWPGCPQNDDLSGVFFVFLFWLVYPLTPAFLLYFTTLFPVKKRIIQRHQKLPVVIFIPSFIFVFLLEATYLASVFTRNLEIYRYFYHIYNYGFRTFFILYLALGIGSLIHSYITSTTKENRSKVQWIIWGISLGLFPFLFLWTLPQQLGFPPLIPEIVIYLFMMMMPISVAFSIIKYQALNIEFIIEKSIVYILTALFFLFLFLLIAGLTELDLRRIISTYRFQLNVGIVLLAILFTPIVSQKTIVGIRRYFKGELNFPLIIKNFNAALATIHDRVKVIDLLSEQINTIIPVEKMALIFRDNSVSTFTVAGSLGIEKKKLAEFQNEFSASLVKAAEQQKNSLGMKVTGFSKEIGEPSYSEIYKKLIIFPYYLGKKIWEFLFTQPDKQVADFPENHVFAKLGIQIIIPIFLHDRLSGITALGQKLSGKEFSDEDIEIVGQMAAESFKTIERIELQETMIIAQAEKKKLEELNRLKSDFVSFVSHELRSPLTSICWSVENLLDGIPEKPSPKIRDYLAGIHDSSSHLRRMIENLLDLTKIEAGKIEIYPEKLVLLKTIHQSLAVLKPSIEEKKVQFEIKVNEKTRVKADPGHLKEILTNLFDNAIKYSNEGNLVRIVAKPEAQKDFSENESKSQRMVIISIIDHGIGIPEDMLATIFDRFVRMKRKKRSEKGLGLGLHIVKKLVELQGGSISVKSSVRGGSTFTIALPDGLSD